MNFMEFISILFGIMDNRDLEDFEMVCMMVGNVLIYSLIKREFYLSQKGLNYDDVDQEIMQ